MYIEELKANKDVEGLINALRITVEDGVRAESARALAEIGDTRAIKPLILVLKLEEIGAPSRRHVAEALKKLEGKKK
jgi:HEAT repeat protein